MLDPERGSVAVTEAPPLVDRQGSRCLRAGRDWRVHPACAEADSLHLDRSPTSDTSHVKHLRRQRQAARPGNPAGGGNARRTRRRGFIASATPTRRLADTMRHRFPARPR